MGSRFLIESLAVNPKEVFTFAPTSLEVSKESPGQVCYSIELESSIKDRDSRGYNRSVTITAFGLGVDFSTPKNAIPAFDLLMDLLLQATEEGFDFQWSALDVRGASGTNPDLASARISLTSFQFEDFKQFLRNRIGSEDQARFYRIDFDGISEAGTRFIPNELIEVILELDFEWKNFLQILNQKADPRFQVQLSVGGLLKINQKPNGRLTVAFEVRFLPGNDPVKMDEIWKAVVARISQKYATFHFSTLRTYLVPGVAVEGAPVPSGGNTTYLSDAGLFHKGKFPVSILGAGSVDNLPKGPNEAIRWSELERAIETYRNRMLQLIQS